MIGYVGTGASFYDCIRYCLEDKKQLSEEDKRRLSECENVQHKDRSEVLFYNKCYGDKYELAEEFRSVAKLSKRVEKPVFHLALRIAPGELLGKEKWMEIGVECAREFGIADNQYICVLHKDTKEQHIHIVANRVGFDGKVASDSNSYRKMAALCRKLEHKFSLKEVLSPRAFLPPYERLRERNDVRKAKLSKDIMQTLHHATSWKEFFNVMEGLGYRVMKGRGIAFIDKKNVKIKGSEIGFSLAKIERVLTLRRSQIEGEKDEQIARSNMPGAKPHTTRMAAYGSSGGKEENGGAREAVITTELKNLLELLLRSEYVDNHVSFELTEAGIKKRKKRKRGYNQGLGH